MPPTPSAYRFHAKLHVFFTFSKQPEPRSLPHSPRREFFPFEGWRTATLNLSSFNTALIDMQGTSTLDVIGGLTLNFGSVQISSIATGLIVGILVNVIFNKRSAEEKGEAKAE